MHDPRKDRLAEVTLTFELVGELNTNENGGTQPLYKQLESEFNSFSQRNIKVYGGKERKLPLKNWRLTAYIQYNADELTEAAVRRTFLEMSGRSSFRLVK